MAMRLFLRPTDAGDADVLTRSTMGDRGPTKSEGAQEGGGG